METIADFFEWVQEVIEKRWGKAWAWIIYAALLLLFVGGAIWLIELGYSYLFGTSPDRVRSSETGIAMPSPKSGTFNINSDSPSVSVSNIADAERASRDLINQAGHSCDVVTSLSPVGWVESGGTLHRANCSHGEQYFVVLSDENRIRFLSSCADFTASTGEQC